MALFGKNKNDKNKNAPDGDNGTPVAEWTPQPEKARKWFDHASASADSANYDYALTCYANAFKLDPESMDRHESMYAAALRYGQNGGKPGAGKDLKDFDDGSPAAKFAAAEYFWMKDLNNLKLAVKTLETAIGAGQLEYGKWAARLVLAIMQKQKKISKSQLKNMIPLFQQVEAFEESMEIARIARELDPSDSEIENIIKDLSAELAMTRGGYDQAGKEGGFRGMIKDADKQKELMEEEALGGGTAEDRNLARAKLAHDESPTESDAINHYAQLLKKRATPETVEQARHVYLGGFERTGEYRFRMYAGDIEIEQLGDRLKAASAAMEEAPDDEDKKAERESLRNELLDLQSTEYNERIKQYPTDRFRKFDLGMVQYARGDYDDAMAQFQNAKDEPKLHARAAQMLGRCFMAERWYSEATAEYRESLQVLEVTEKERELEIRYDLMLALMDQAKDEDSGEFAREAKEICSEIARKNITYNDIRQKRREIDELIRTVT